MRHRASGRVVILLAAGFFALSVPGSARAETNVTIGIDLGFRWERPLDPLWHCLHLPVCRDRLYLRRAPREETPPPPPTVDDARAQIDAGRFAAAEDTLRIVVRSQPGDPEAWGLLGEAQRKLGRLSDARASLGRALRIDPGHPGALYQQGLIFLSTGAPDRAKENLALLRDGCGDCRDYNLLRSALTGAGYPEAVPGAKWIRVAP